MVVSTEMPMLRPPEQRSGVQESIFRALESAEPELAALYEGVRWLVAADPPMPGHAWFVAHGLRELVDAIPALADGMRPRGGFDYGTPLRKVASMWGPLGLLDPPDGNGISREVPNDSLAVVAELARYAERYGKRRQRLEEAFVQRTPGVGRSRHEIWAKELNSLYQDNAGRAHRGSGWPEPRAYEEHFRKIELVLAGIFGEYGSNRRELDDILATANRGRD